MYNIKDKIKDIIKDNIKDNIKNKIKFNNLNTMGCDLIVISLVESQCGNNTEVTEFPLASLFCQSLFSYFSRRVLGVKTEAEVQVQVKPRNFRNLHGMDC